MRGFSRAASRSRPSRRWSSVRGGEGRFSRGRWFWLAGSLSLLSLTAVGWIVVFDVLGRDPDRSPAVAALVSVAGMMGLLAFIAVGALIGWLRPQNAVGWLLLSAGLVWMVGEVVARQVNASDGSGLGVAVGAALLDSVGWVLGLALIAVTFLVFPTGRTLTRRWLGVAWLIVGGGLILSIALLLTPGPLESWPWIDNPLGVARLADALRVVSSFAEPVFFAGFLGALGSVVVRFRRSSGLERQQLLWLVFAAVLVIVGFVIGGLLTFFGLPGEPLFNVVPLFMLPLAVGVSVLRYRVWDLDLVVVRVLTYGLLATAITVIFIIMLAGFGALIGASVSGGGCG